MESSRDISKLLRISQEAAGVAVNAEEAFLETAEACCCMIDELSSRRSKNQSSHPFWSRTCCLFSLGPSTAMYLASSGFLLLRPSTMARMMRLKQC